MTPIPMTAIRSTQPHLALAADNDVDDGDWPDSALEQAMAKKQATGLPSAAKATVTPLDRAEKSHRDEMMHRVLRARSVQPEPAPRPLNVERGSAWPIPQWLSDEAITKALARVEAEREKFHRRFEEVRHLLSPDLEAERLEKEISRTTDVKKLNELRAEITWCKSPAAKSARHQAEIIVKNEFYPYASAVGELLKVGLEATAGVEKQARDGEAAFFSHYGLMAEPTGVSLRVDRLKSRLKQMQRTLDVRVNRAHITPIKSELDAFVSFFRLA